MAIINLKTDLRTLKYSNVLSVPYVYTSLPKGYEKNPFPLDPKTGDALLVGRAMNSIPGVRFAIHEAILGSDPAKILKIIGSSLAQVAVNGTGTHLIRGFNPDIYEQDRYGDVPGGFTRSGGRDEIRVSRDSALRAEGSSTLEEVSFKPSGSVISTSEVVGQKVWSTEKELVSGPQVTTNYIPIQGTEGREKKEIPKEFFLDIRAKFREKKNIDTEGVNEELKIEDEDHISELLGSDIIPFEFQVITPEKRKTLYFRAFLGDLNDDFTGTVGKERYVGRAEEFFIYQGFSRIMSFSFKVAAFSEEHLKPMYDKLNALAGATAPTYNKSGQFMRGTLGRVTIGDYIVKQYGMFEKIGISWKQDYPWEINLEGTKLLRVPQMLDVSVSFLPIHTFGVEEGQRFFGGRR